MKKKIENLEEQRLVLQTKLDAEKEQAERNRKGQFATPTALALDILQYAKLCFREDEKVRFFDPAMGTGAFYSALLRIFPRDRLECMIGYEIDPHYGMPALQLWQESGLEMRIADFTQASSPSKKMNLLICNPPYVRHHHIASGEKQRLKRQARKVCGAEMSGLAGLYCYFLGLSHGWMAEGGLAGWLIPSEFMNVNYGFSVKRYLLEQVTLLHVHRFDPEDVQFADALVSSVVVWFCKEKPTADHLVRFTYGGSLLKPKWTRKISANTLCLSPKWTQYPMKESHKITTQSPVLGDFFKIKRGLVTGDNLFFILALEEINSRGLPLELFRPILPSPRYLSEDEIQADSKGNPILEKRLFLLDCQLQEAEVKKNYPQLWDYLEEGKKQGTSRRYLCRHRTPWYAQEKRPPTPFICTYMGRSESKRGRPFRFILNHSQATASNVYLMLYPTEKLERLLKLHSHLIRDIWETLNEICPQAMLDESRVYGGGLHKLEPKELGKVPALAIAQLLPKSVRLFQEKQGELFNAVGR